MPVAKLPPLAMVNGIPRYCPPENYTASFGFQWNSFAATQLDAIGQRQSEQRLFGETGWEASELQGLDILEVGSGAGRFSRVILETTGANLYSSDFSNAVEANLANNGHIAPDRFDLVQASIYDLPYPAASFDKVFCFGVLQHTPDFEASIKSLARMVKPGGELVVDFYPVRGWWTKIHAKYLLRPLTKRIPPRALLAIIRFNIPWLIAVYHLLTKLRLGVLTRFLPICDLAIVNPKGLDLSTYRERAVLDTFDMFSPQYDNPQRVSSVTRMVLRTGLSVTFAGYLDAGSGQSAVVRAVRLCST